MGLGRGRGRGEGEAEWRVSDALLFDDHAAVVVGYECR